MREEFVRRGGRDRRFSKRIANGFGNCDLPTEKFWSVGRRRVGFCQSRLRGRRRSDAGRRHRGSIWQSATGTLRLSAGHRHHQVQQHQPNHPTTLQILRFHVCPTLLCLTKFFYPANALDLTPLRPNANRTRPERAHREIPLLLQNEKPSIRWRPKAFRCEITWSFFIRNPKCVVCKKMTKQWSPESTLLWFAFSELGTRFPAGWFPSIRKQSIPSSGVDGRFLPRPTNAQSFRHPKPPLCNRRMSTALNHV